MSYFDAQDITQVMTGQQVVDLTSDERAGTEYLADWSVVETARDGVEGTLNGLLAVRVTVPVASPTGELIMDAMRLTKIQLFRRRERATEDMTKEEGRILDKYRRISEGRAELAGITTKGAAVKAGGNTGSSPSIWSDDEPWGP